MEGNKNNEVSIDLAVSVAMVLTKTHVHAKAAYDAVVRLMKDAREGMINDEESKLLNDALVVLDSVWKRSASSRIVPFLKETIE
ncbi:MAG TPA: hypothetical protein VEA58_07345, partial [Anaerovoracaceae bacterium]|nr:hypothetical protein [Anaerovoracaceae bacterium]